MNQPVKHTLKIIPFKNPSGKLVWRVTGRIAGIVIQKNFPTRDAAEGFMHGCIASPAQGKSAPRRTALTIFETDQKLHASELAHDKLQKAIPGGSLFSAIYFFLSQSTVVWTDLPAKEAIDRFTANRTGRGNQEITANNSRTVLRKFIGVQKITLVSEMIPAKVKAFA